MATAPALGTFAERSINTQRNSMSLENLVITDLNGDGYSDAVASGGGSVNTSFGTATGQLVNNTSLGFGGTITKLKAADIDRDGDIDLLVPRARTNEVLVVRNNGSGGFFSSMTIANVSYNPISVAAGDLDSDGDLDMLVACGSGSINVCFNNTGGFNSVQNRTLTFPGAHTVVPGDLDNDGDLDFVVSSSTTGIVGVWRNNGSGQFTQLASLATGSSPTGSLLGDINADGILDLVVANNGSYTVSVALGTGTGAFQISQSLTAGAPLDVLLGDVDGDGDLDLAVPQLNGANSILTWRNSGQGVFTSSTAVPVTFLVGAAFTDLNGDGTMDLVSAGRELDTYGYYFYGINLNGSTTQLTSSATSFCTGDQIAGTLTLSYAYGTFTGYQSNTGSGFQDIPGSGTDPTYSFANLAVTTGFRAVFRSPEGRVFYSSTVEVKVHPLPAVTLSAVSATTFCGSGWLQLQATPTTAGHTYKYFRNGVLVSTSNTANPTIFVTSSGSYTVAVTTAAGCTSTSTPVNVVVNPTPNTPVLRARTQASGAALLTTNAPNNHFYRFGQSTPVATGASYLVTSASNTYTARAISAAGCISGESNFAFAQVLSPALVWTGAISQAWNDPVNWSGGVVPAVSARVQVPATAVRTPEISAGTVIQVRDLYVDAGATLTINGGELSITGNATLDGTLANPAGTIRFAGFSPQLLSTTVPQVYNDLVVGTGGLTLEGQASIRGLLDVRGNLVSNGALTLLSDATGTAVVANNGGVVQGAVTVQRYITPTTNAGTGYRHFSSPVLSTTVADLATASFAPVVNPGYNTSATPNAVTPFPTVFGYSEARVLTSPATTYSSFDKGWFSPAGPQTGLVPGRGYTVQIAPQTVDFVGTLNNGTIQQTLTRSAADAGWNLVGNPYPSPLDWSRVTVPAGLNNAIYVHQSTTAYGGAYLSYVNGVGNPIVALGQGFFVRVSEGTSSVTLPFTNLARVTSPTVQPVFQRSVETRPLVQLTLRSAATPLADEAYVYFENGATSGFDSGFDALKLKPGSAAMAVYLLAAGTELSINGLPEVTANTVVDLALNLPAAGMYTLEATQLLNLSSFPTYLYDAVTGQMHDLRQQPRYAFSAGVGSLRNRFTLRFDQQRPLANHPGLTAAGVTLYPNPARQHFTASVPGVPGAQNVVAVLYNGLGQLVQRQTAALPATGTQLRFETNSLSAGVYTLQLQVGAAVLTKRVVIE
ncbi:FG-GAP-like repeat-containing protein [Hymenobacter sp. BT175]|uniref:FG-GAP-like repeat-containing protein n=1 Tax=Hymenobacter translucens TaxID=2886507 RepID=UPI001D0E8A7D|nr:FG-GAP-like repeat-containing protein [Hymenobacter translucens]MCC2548240.1 FG-GAP-like repeat-containing protein [Hymenobacter translucens]